MFGQLTQGRPSPTGDTTELQAQLRDLGRGESEQSYIAKRMLIGVERRTLPDDTIARLNAMTPNALFGLINRLASRRATIYDLPRQLTLTLSQRFAGMAKGVRALHLS
jgi:hypothetical protein